MGNESEREKKENETIISVYLPVCLSTRLSVCLPEDACQSLHTVSKERNINCNNNDNSKINSNIFFP